MLVVEPDGAHRKWDESTLQFRPTNPLVFLDVALKRSNNFCPENNQVCHITHSCNVKVRV